MAIITPINAYKKQEDVEIPALHTSQIRSIALAIFETVMGTRSVLQLTKWVAPHAISQLSLQRSLRTEQMKVYQKTDRVLSIPGRVTLSRTHETKMHAAVVMHSQHKSYAIALCFEHLHAGWRVTDLAVL